MTSEHELATCDCPGCSAERTAWAREQLMNLAVNEVFGVSAFSTALPPHEE